MFAFSDFFFVFEEKVFIAEVFDFVKVNILNTGIR